jgi:anti-sigma B factor antagonist
MSLTASGKARLAMEITSNQHGEVTVVGLAGRFDAQSAGEAEAAFNQALEEGSHNLVVDMSGVEYISSAGLRVLLSTAKKLSASGGKLVLAGLKPYVQEVFEVAGFTAIFQIYPDLDAGLKAF